MVPACSGIAPEGRPAIGLTALGALVFALVGWEFLALVFFVLCAFSVHFFRDPERVAPRGEGVAASPADGRILHVQKRPDPLTGEEKDCISIFMNLFNVHVNRVPVDCEITDIRYWPGKFINASFDKASEDNERCAWQLRDADGGIWCMVQIAGLIARRIVCRAAVGDRLARGERYGMIRFGSRVDLYLPAGYSATVREGDKVYAGQTAIAAKNDAAGAGHE